MMIGRGRLENVEMQMVEFDNERIEIGELEIEWRRVIEGHLEVYLESLEGLHKRIRSITLEQCEVER